MAPLLSTHRNTALTFASLMAFALGVTNDLVAAGKFVTVVESYPQPVIGRELAASFGVLGGFETGNVIKEDGKYHMFYGEKASPTTYPWKMGWTTAIGHWVASAATGPWTRLETVLPAGDMWSPMPWFDDASSRWKIFYCNETDRSTRTATAANAGRGSINEPQNWTWTDKDHAPSPDTYSISNPWEAADGSWNVFLDWGLFGVSLAWAKSIEGPYAVSPPTNTNTTTLINTSLAVNSAHQWIENPVVTPIPANHSNPSSPVSAVATGYDGADRGGMKWAAMFDWVQGGGEPAGSPLPFLGFSWSEDGKSWPAEHGELVSVEPSGTGQSRRKVWTELVRTPTALIPEDDGTFTVFYAARDTSNASSRTGNSTQPFTNCSVPPTSALSTRTPDYSRRHRHKQYQPGQREKAEPAGLRLAGNTDSAPPPPPPGWGDGCFWGIGMLRVQLHLE
eukprot:COSAG02_NODE_7395_length_3036_cov_1.262853_5_plen_450_part_00